MVENHSQVRQLGQKLRCFGNLTWTYGKIESQAFCLQKGEILLELLVRKETLRCFANIVVKRRIAVQDVPKAAESVELLQFLYQITDIGG